MRPGVCTGCELCNLVTSDHQFNIASYVKLRWRVEGENKSFFGFSNVTEIEFKKK